MEEKTQSMGSAVQQSLEDLRQQFSDDYMTPALDTMKESITDRPKAAALVAFGAGFAVGLMLVGAMGANPPARRRSLRSVQNLGEQVLDAVAKVLPQSIASQLNR